MNVLEDREQVTRGVWRHPPTGRLVVRPDLLERKKYRGAGKPRWEIWVSDLSGGMFPLEGEPTFARLDEALSYLSTGSTEAWFLPADIDSPWEPWQAAEAAACIACGEPTLMRGNETQSGSRAAAKCSDLDACRGRRSTVLVDLEIQRWSKDDTLNLISRGAERGSVHTAQKRYECAGNGDAANRQHMRGCPGVMAAGALYVATTSIKSRAFGLKVCVSPQCFESYWAARDE